MPKTTEQLLTQATEKLTKDMETHIANHDDAISAFRQAANKLAVTNEGLKKTINNLDVILSFANEKRSSAELAISDNERVRAKILEIIGE